MASTQQPVVSPRHLFMLCMTHRAELEVDLFTLEEAPT
jgi:hypothetical protein